ncbi:hypothetical protein [Nonomuraea soli]|uniref:Helix-turn-helix domain-containing protein n=1 Tax=Nonomuraea soli TaxID=1032476 RepID=A0A7W0HVN9_9ACTN|nr:hypothetical protein [Nonomuraea soli]MBA2897370.1 hypothetical protein [Nonomuraea soli]
MKEPEALPEDWPDHEDPDGQQDAVETGYESDSDGDYFARVMYYVLDHPALAGRDGRLAKDAYICLVRFANWSSRKTKATREKLAAVMSISTDTFDRGIRLLEKAGIVEVVKARDAQGRWRTSRYVLVDTSGARARRRIIELERELEETRAAANRTSEASPQVESTPQIAAPTVEHEDRESGSHSANCGTVQSADCGTVHSANCGQYLEKVFTTREEETDQEEKQEPVLAVGADTVRTARASATAPPAKKEDLQQVARATFASISRRYADALPSIRRAMIARIEREIGAGLGPGAIITYARRFADDDTLPLDKHAHRLDLTLRRLHADIKAGDACRECGHDPADRFGPLCDACRPDRSELTEEELASIESAIKSFLESEPA